MGPLTSYHDVVNLRVVWTNTEVVGLLDTAVAPGEGPVAGCRFRSIRTMLQGYLCPRDPLRSPGKPP